MNKTIYVKDRERWARAVALAHQMGISVSELIAIALDQMFESGPAHCDCTCECCGGTGDRAHCSCN